jgi:hypothetical protein
LPDWELRLHAFAQSVLGLPFVLGETNCSILAARAIDSMTGSNHWKTFAEVATTDETELAESSNHRTKAEFEATGFSKVRKNFEQPGDILIGWKDPFERCGVYLGGDKLLTSSRTKGVVIIPLGVFNRAYSPEVFRWA